jgi:hypothetical protein
LEREKQLQVNSPRKTSDSEPKESTFDAQKKLVDELKVQWKLMWSERFNDKARAEGVSIADYASLMVERGTIIHATRDFKALSFKEIVIQNMIKEPDRFIQPDVNVGGWNKFIKTKITSCNTQKSKRINFYIPKKNTRQQPKKNGRGWLHTT